MAILQFNVKDISRARGSSAVSSAAYIARTKLKDERLNRTIDYTARGGLAHSEILLPTNAPEGAAEWARDRSKLWNAAEKAERRRDARVAREYVVALPHELSEPQRLALARGFAQGVADRYGVAADLAIHTPPPGGDARNHHAHILATTRVVEAQALGRKTDLSLGDWERRERGLRSSREELRQLRIDWAGRVNDKLHEAGLELAVDARSYWERGIPMVGQQRFGPRLVALARAGETRLVDRLREEHAARNQRMQELADAAALRDQPAAHAAEVPPQADAKAHASGAERAASAVDTRAAEQALTIDERQRRAAERWLGYRAEMAAGKHATARATLGKERDLGADIEI